MIMIAVVIWDSAIGLGLHAWDVDSPDNLVKIAKVFYVMKLFYIIVQVLIKVSILLFYLRVFPVTWIHVLTWILIAFTLLHGIAFFFAIIFQCTPVAMIWNPRVEGHCIQLETIIFPGAIFSIVEDLAILLLPIPCLSKLNVGRGKKISLICMFSVGTVYVALKIHLLLGIC
ncbi:integral membrane protein [Rhexocercosporidium sp. MPI-PUGE-AT-0058]|nr:integral membrane protein [Rhexocercosporidium sp. MPI-PUGE-AT-0058]